MTPQELLNANDIYLANYDLGNHTSICPQCSHARKPAHQKTECVSVKIDDKGPTWYCHHCGYSGPPKGGGKSNGQGGEFAATYDYPGFQKVRYPKGHEPRFRIHHREGNGWKWGAGSADTSVLYRKDEVDKAIALGRTILVVEGEKDVDRCWSIGIPATCNAHGAAEPGKKPKWRAEHSAQLPGADIVVIPDHDDAGYAHCDATCRTSLGVAKRVRRLVLAEHWSECPKGADISDWLDAGHGREELDTLIDEAPDCGKAESEKKGAKSQRHADEIMRLAKLTAVEYEHQRKGAAEKLGISRIKVLDKLVERERARIDPDGGKQGQGQPIEFPEPDAWPDEVKGTELLNEIATAVRRDVVMPDRDRDICALWAVYTHLVDCFLVAPRLAIRSPTPECGKTTLLDVIEHLVPKPLRTSSITAAVTFRVIAMCQPTLLVDEAKNIADKTDLLEVLNDGHRRGGRTIRNVPKGDGYEPRAFATFAALAIALIGSLPPELHGRSVVIDLKRRLPGDAIEEVRVGRNEHLDVLARKAMRWAADNAVRIADMEPAMPPGIYNREADNWKPLLAIADAAGGEEWPKRARDAASKSHAAADIDDASTVEMLLADIRDTFAAEGPEKSATPVADMFAEKADAVIASTDLVKALVAIEGRPWAEMGKSRKPLTTNGLARKLKPLGIAPQLVRTGQQVARAYRLSQFQEAFSRYLPPEGVSNRCTVSNAENTGTSEPSQNATAKSDVTVAKYEKSSNDGLCNDVTVAKRGSGEKTHVRTSKAKGPGGLDEHGAPQAPQDQGLPGASASVPFMMTQETKRRLRICGYSDAQIAGMTPQAAHNILGQWAPHGEPGLSSRRIQALADWYADKAYYQYSAINAGDLDAKLRAILREEVFPEHVEIEFQRVKKAVWRGH